MSTSGEEERCEMSTRSGIELGLGSNGVEEGGEMNRGATGK